MNESPLPHHQLPQVSEATLTLLPLDLHGYQYHSLDDAFWVPSTWSKCYNLVQLQTHSEKCHHLLKNKLHSFFIYEPRTFGVKVVVVTFLEGFSLMVIKTMVLKFAASQSLFKKWFLIFTHPRTQNSARK